MDAPAKEYAPAIGELQVIDGFDDAGQPKLRAPKTDVTTRQLLLHQGGFAYDFFNETYNRLAQEYGQPSVIPSLSNCAEFFPGMPKSWGLTFMINDEDAPTGCPAGALAWAGLAWAGLANLYYWIDRQNGIGGFWATQIFPFADPASVGGYLDFEAAVYANLAKAAA